MSEARVGSAVELLGLAVDRLLTESPAELPPAEALARCSALLVSRERLGAAALAAVRDVDSRELFALDASGSARGWLRSQLGGDAGQLAQARRLVLWTAVYDAQAAGELSGRGATQLCAALDQVPVDVPAAALEAVLVDGLRSLLGRELGLGLPKGTEPTAAHLALRAELAHTAQQALADDARSPAQRLEPAVLLLARYIAPGQLGWALDYLLDALLPDGIGEPDERRFFLDLVPVLDGEWDLRGHLDHETGTLLAAELTRRQQAHSAARVAGAAGRVDGAGAVHPAQTAAESETADHDDPAPGDPALGDQAVGDQAVGDEAEADPLADWDAALTAEPDPHASPAPVLLPQGRRRHDALTQLLRDSAERDAGSGRPAPAAITITATVEAVEGRLGALPGLLLTTGRPVSLRSEELRRLGCFSELTAVLVDAAGRPVGASSTRRSANHRERAALISLWGPWCAIKGCTSTDTVPHHVEPWWLSRQTLLRDLIPICTHDHHDLHEGHRTLRLKDGRLIDELGWVTTTR